MNEYTNLDVVRRHLTLASQDVSDDADILRYIRDASRAIDRYTRRRFYPRVETRNYDYSDALEQDLDDDLLAVNTLTTQNGACTIASTVYWLSSGSNWNRTPYNEIILNDTSGSLFQYSNTYRQANAVAGIWGYHETYGSAWLDTGTSLSASMSATNPSLELAGAGSTGVGASDVEYNAPRMSIGTLVKVGDEFMNIQAAGSTATLAIVARGVNGSTAASHASGASIAKWMVEPEIEFSARMLTAWQYSAKDAPFQMKLAMPVLGQVSIPEAWPVQIKDKLNRFKRRKMGTY